MPFIQIDYTNNLVDQGAFEPCVLVQEMNRTLLATGQFGDDDIKTLARGSDVYARSSQARNKAFMCVTVSLLSGRTHEVKHEISMAVMEMLRAQVKAIDGLETQVSVNMRDMDRDSFVKVIF